MWEAGHGRGVVSIFGPVRAERMAYRSRREANLYPADARWILPEDPYSVGMRALAAYHLAEGGYGQALEVIAARTGVTVGRAQLADLAGDVDPAKDVDGANPVSLGRLMTGLPTFAPATAEAVLALLDFHQVALSGRRAVVVSRAVRSDR